MKWVVATHNRDKFREIKAIFADLPIELLNLEEFPDVGAVKETGTSLRANALLKAHSVHLATGLPVIADDTGLEVDALNGAPGVYAARYAGPRATYHQNVEKLLVAMKYVPDQKRTARFRTCAAFVNGAHELVASGVVEGYITRKPVGDNGFGYDPVFRLSGSIQTFGQMTSEQKHQISHRARAFKALHELLSQTESIKQNKETPA
ncbi:MAG: RdgB/HAM1 family non-canonical purine NTP pyrophosphatase [Fidelibacterota bacterium]|nr:MAG: RdgB/HAM1 family non-canonical purine NTP pyrophosphatase [Candidatus Neomarinimicrobiota bacterium]